MIDPHHIIQPETVLDPFHPPGILCLLMVGPAVKRISPELARSRKSVRRTARHRQRFPLLTELEQFRIGPGIRAVQGHIDGNIPDDADPPVIGILFQLFPLPVKAVLLEPVKSDFLLQFRRGLFQCLRMPLFQRFRPFQPGILRLRALDGHVQAIVFQPESVFFAESPVPLIFLKSGKRFPQNFKTCLINAAVIYRSGIFPAVRLPALLLCQKPFLFQCVQIDIIGIPGKSRKRLIGRIPVARRPKRQDLPVLLARLCQPVHEFIGFSGKTADPIPLGQGGYRK